MEVVAVWKGCQYFKNCNKKIDAFVIKCTLYETKCKIEPLLTGIQKHDLFMSNKTRSSAHPDFYFLVSDDIKYIEPLEWFCDVFSLLGQNSPYKKIKNFKIENLEDIKDINY
ncbi:hypothetical protein [Clostridium sp. HV4-5-A1G]|uniref:hypothetical protein n=1 Tax=Clostridium sp. HV4-5-A1G TaxID=2004595 RepID=UPI00123AD5FF|nr:hypothetical protein [Clostridium sp. HV4-5-A1G]KAA8674311.1 hypothetical protein F3O63_08505 [Clostridium sp. HV4-5-A1G]